LHFFGNIAILSNSFFFFGIFTQPCGQGLSLRPFQFPILFTTWLESNCMIYIVFFLDQIVHVDLKNHFFHKQKFESGFPKFIYTWKALNHSILINVMLVMRSFSLQAIMDSLL